MEKSTIKNRHGLDLVVVVEPGSKGLAFVSHGLGGFKEQKHIRLTANVLNTNGYTVVTWDSTNTLGESGGQYEDATTTNYYEDFVDVVKWASEQSWYQEPFILAGHSLGGYCAAYFAEEHPEQVKALLPMCPMVSGALSHQAHQEAYPQEYNEWKRSGIRVTESKSKPGVKKRLKWSHMKDRLEHDLLPQVEKLTMPTLLVAAEKDVGIPINHIRQLFEVMPGNRKRLAVISGADHNFRGEGQLEELREALQHWMAQFSK